MGQLAFQYANWPGTPLEDAGYFTSTVVPEVRDAVAGVGLAADILEESGETAFDAVVVLFPVADHTHRAWRLAAIQQLAREAAPTRVNGVVGEDFDATDEIVSWLANAPGVTGQLLAVDGKFTKSR